jgi:hypothetical protein
MSGLRSVRVVESLAMDLMESGVGRGRGRGMVLEVESEGEFELIGGFVPRRTGLRSF